MRTTPIASSRSTCSWRSMTRRPALATWATPGRPPIPRSNDVFFVSGRDPIAPALHSIARKEHHMKKYLPFLTAAALALGGVALLVRAEDPGQPNHRMDMS